MDKKIVLVVEDDRNIRDLYVSALEMEDLEVHGAENGVEGVTLALALHPDLILMDIVMPNMDGHSAVEEIRKDDWGKDAHILYLTNKNDADNLVKATELGTDEYVLKINTPIKELVQKVKDKLGI